MNREALSLSTSEDRFSVERQKFANVSHARSRFVRAVERSACDCHGRCFLREDRRQCQSFVDFLGSRHRVFSIPQPTKLSTSVSTVVRLLTRVDREMQHAISTRDRPRLATDVALFETCSIKTRGNREMSVHLESNRLVSIEEQQVL